MIVKCHIFKTIVECDIMEQLYSELQSNHFTLQISNCVVSYILWYLCYRYIPSKCIHIFITYSKNISKIICISISLGIIITRSILLIVNVMKYCILQQDTVKSLYYNFTLITMLYFPFVLLFLKQICTMNSIHPLMNNTVILIKFLSLFSYTCLLHLIVNPLM